MRNDKRSTFYDTPTPMPQSYYDAIEEQIQADLASPHPIELKVEDGRLMATYNAGSDDSPWLRIGKVVTIKVVRGHLIGSISHGAYSSTFHTILLPIEGVDGNNYCQNGTLFPINQNDGSLATVKTSVKKALVIPEGFNMDEYELLGERFGRATEEEVPAEYRDEYIHFQELDIIIKSINQ